MVDTHAATELKLYIDNDSSLYHLQTLPILKNLATKRARGEYKHDLAVKLFGYLVEAGAKKYVAEFAAGQPWNRMFDVATRKKVSEALTRDFEAEDALGNYDHLLPKKYREQEAPGGAAPGRGGTAHARKKLPAPGGAKSGRVEILDSGGSSYFKPGQFGYVVGSTTRGGMYTLDRGPSGEGELTYLVSKRPKEAGGGALWFSAGALRFTGRQGAHAAIRRDPVARSAAPAPRSRAQIEREISQALSSYRGGR